MSLSFELAGSGTFASAEGGMLRTEQWGGMSPTFASRSEVAQTISNLQSFLLEQEAPGETYLINALPNAVLMQTLSPGSSICITEIDESEVRRKLAGGFISAVGHEVTAESLSAKLKYPVKFNRIQVSLRPGDTVICALVQTPNRAPEGWRHTEAALLSFPVRYIMFQARAETE